MQPNEAEHALFADALACTLDLPVAFTERAPEAGTPERAIERAEHVLRAIALVETHADDSDEDTGRDQALQRIEAKLDLLFELIGKVARRGIEPLPLRRLRWSRLGVELTQPLTAATLEHGFLLLQPVDWLPQPIELPVRQLHASSSDDGAQTLLLKFEPLPPSLESAIERHLFRLHRRQIATARGS